MDKKKPTTKGKLGNESRINSPRSHTPLTRFIAWIKLGSTDSFTTMQELDICRPSPRTSNTRAIGHPIKPPNLANLYLFSLSPTGVDLALLICLEVALWIS
ncbi:helix-turn-helix domain-containing protein [Pseudomonas laurylsulfatiphila]|uniref:helix-turn-helix domain-containing protein n=1 Tax=Pseudomonas laurylsulfatiphila TaxID=2011015 RepID=UPI00215F6E02|nr:helix-turn-helix domain-containing protein [Pseudomonas laurylsulfatiphila]UVM07127.1 helix-turn-helix domain-containing protein [Pseudomonas laurylsulfatiphila]